MQKPKVLLCQSLYRSRSEVKFNLSPNTHFVNRNPYLNQTFGLFYFHIRVVPRLLGLQYQSFLQIYYPQTRAIAGFPIILALFNCLFYYYTSQDHSKLI
jgi:hypothetical protein